MRKRFIDIGANLTDLQFRGIYHGKKYHPDDLSGVIARAKQANVQHILVTGSNLEESKTALQLCREHPKFLASTVGVHPCHAADIPMDDEAQRDAYFRDLEQLVVEGVREGHVKAFGEIGLDYDRLHYASVDQQKRVFQIQLDLAARLGLPLFLHSRNAAHDFHSMIKPYASKLRGVVHSFTGTPEELSELLALGLYIGVNGCSLKSGENLNVVKQIPLTSLMLETDGPWCEIRPTHASFPHIKPLPFEQVKSYKKWAPDKMVRGRCEPCTIENVAEVVAAVHNVPLQEVIDRAYTNSMDVFKFDPYP